MSDAPVAEIGEVTYGECDPGLVVPDHGGERSVLDGPVHQYDWKSRIPDLLENRMIVPSGRGDEAVDLPRPHGAHVHALALGVVVRVRDQRGVARFLQTVLDAAHDRREQRIGDVRDQHPDRVGAIGLQSTGDRIRPVPELFGDGKHTTGGVAVDEAAGLRVERREAVPGWTSASRATSLNVTADTTPGCWLSPSPRSR